MLQTEIAKISEYLTNLRTQVTDLESQLEWLKQRPDVKKSDPRLTEIRGKIRTLKARIADSEKMPDFAVNSYCKISMVKLAKLQRLKKSLASY